MSTPLESDDLFTHVEIVAAFVTTSGPRRLSAMAGEFGVGQAGDFAAGGLPDSDACAPLSPSTEDSDPSLDEDPEIPATD